ncbi:hypothetical protein [Muricoccus radiodurans]|uniref:hypothetical protein n=1 Tax=Muricoccus radiodurans TaxID=2231721 RepID=UPI003CF15E8A
MTRLLVVLVLAAVVGLFATLPASTVVPLLTLAVIVGLFASIWWLRRTGPASPDPSSPAVEAGRERIAHALRDALDRTPFGPHLAAEVWDALMQRPQGEGLIVEQHRDYCGHGLIHRGRGVILAEIQDGYDPGPHIATWTDRDDFISFFARQSDLTCSGWDPAEPVFHTEDPWRRNNQRLTRAVLRRFLRRGA